jgi:hypothetical protein
MNQTAEDVRDVRLVKDLTHFVSCPYITQDHIDIG